ncbi:MAG: helix-turn-helix domain-containing protein [Nocardiopsaceae bacterium]|nr:helix-turn-helix domain-containing protein [Nocardiopsaceae bacterium]
MPESPRSKGHLNPGSAGLRFDRFELGAGLSGLVRHVWVPRWSLPDGEVRPQRVLTYPAFNIVITPEYAALFGPDSRVHVQELRGTSWAVGILFRPAAGPLLTATDPVALAGSSEPLSATLVGATSAGAASAGRIREVMADSADHMAASVGSQGEIVRDQIVRILRDWLLPVAARVDDRGRLVNEACRLAEEDPDLTRAADLAACLGVSPRSLERLVRSHTGLTPKWLIECRRLQQAATTLFGSPDTDLSVLAADLGYTDYPHFFRQYQRVLGESPRATRDHRLMPQGARLRNRTHHSAPNCAIERPYPRDTRSPPPESNRSPIKSPCHRQAGRPGAPPPKRPLALHLDTR